MKAIDDLENKNSSGHDGISNKILKFIKFEISKPLALIISNDNDNDNDNDNTFIEHKYRLQIRIYI